MPPIPELHDLSAARPGLARWRHGLMALMARGRGALLRRVVSWAGEVGAASVLDVMDRFASLPDPIRRIEEGEDPMPGARSVAVYVQFSSSGALSGMVLRQIEAYRALGFAVVLVSNSPAFPEEAWAAARRRAALIVHRHNRGLDFGAWKDLVPVALARWPGVEELLLTNDSVLGPIRPLDPFLARMRNAGPGVYGLVESIQGGPHLQSWFTLAVGPAAVQDVAAFLGRLRLSRSKWKLVQRGELKLARAMRTAGHRVAAVFSYAALVDLALADPAEREYLARVVPAEFAADEAEAARRLLIDRPLNPAHHLWRVLAGPAGCPFIKTELVRRNPGGFPDVARWPELVLSNSPAPLAMLRAHLAGLGP